MLLDEIKKAMRHNSQPLVSDAFEHLKVLSETKFFVAYPSFEIERLYFNKNCAHILDKDKELIETAAKVYFSGSFNSNPQNPNIVVTFEKKKVRGVQVSLMKCIFGFNLNLIIKTFTGWQYLCGRKNRPTRIG